MATTRLRTALTTATRTGAITVGLVLTSPAWAGTIDLQLSATTPTQVTAGSAVAFTVSFRQYQEAWSFSNGGGEPTPDVGLQLWQLSFFEEATEHLAALGLAVGAPGGPQASLLSAPNAPPGTDHVSTWSLPLRFDQPGLYPVTARATATQHKTLRRGSTEGTRECVGFDNSVQCSGWRFIDLIQEDSAWTDSTSATSLPVLVQVLAVPEPPGATLGLLCLLGALVADRAGASARRPASRHGPRHPPAV